MNAKHHSIRFATSRFFPRVLSAILILILVFPVLPAGMLTANAVLFNCDAIIDVPASECEALVALYISTNGANWYNNTNWLSTTTVDDWNGVFVSDHHITEITLSSNHLSGSLPSQLGSLQNLSYLSLTSNLLTGSIPTEIGNLQNLQALSLGYNQLTGDIPNNMGNLTDLNYLYLSHNQLSGPIPAALGNLSNLVELYASYNELTGSIPPELGNMSNLRFLDLGTNQLTGTISSNLGKLTNLLSLNLYRNSLSGTIPPELGNLSNLTSLELSDNKLSGSLPPELGKLTNLEGLWITFNSLSGPIPREYGNLVNLISVGLYYNDLSGSIPEELGNLNRLLYLYLQGNLFTGAIPLEISNLKSLEVFHFFDTHICEYDIPEYSAWKSIVREYRGTDNLCYVTPTYQEHLTTSKVFFDWFEINDAEEYKFVLSEQEDFSTIIASTKTIESSFFDDKPLSFNKDYYWRFKTKVGGIWGRWSPTFIFTSMDPITTPVLVNPPDAALLYPHITLSWNVVTNAVQYKLQVARDISFTDRIFNAKVTDTFQDINDLAPGKYYWRVKAIEEGGLKSPWSEARGFTVTKVMPPVLTSPSNKAITAPDLVLTWEFAVGAVQYKVQVSKDVLFTKLIVNEKTTGTSKELTDLNARSYYWRVKAIDAEGFKSPWSEVFKFTVVIP